MRSNIFKEVKFSIYVFAGLLFVLTLFYLVATMFISMGYKGYEKSKNAISGGYNGTTVIIDPGHGGLDSGASANGLFEKDLNLEISVTLSEYLKIFGYDFALTRTEDVMMYDPNIEESRKRQDLSYRVKFASGFQDSCFVSIHMNKFPLETCKGIQVFYSDKNEYGKTFAQTLRDNVILLQSDNDRKIKNGTDNIYLLEELEMPAVLIECGFLSNYSEANLLKNDDYKKALSLTIYCGIADFLERKQ